MLPRRRRLDEYKRTSEKAAKPQITPSAPILIAALPRPAQFVEPETRQDGEDPPPSNLLEAAAKALLLDEVRDEPAIMAARKLFGDLSHQLTQIERSATAYNVSDSPSTEKDKGLVIDADLFSIGSLESTDESDMGSSDSSKSTSTDAKSKDSAESSKEDKMSSSNKEKDDDDVDEKIIEIIDETEELELEFGSRPTKKCSEEDDEDEDVCDEYKLAFLGATAPIKFASHR
mmetsp:Transcript_2094/g.6030  ORF Transcript_2094/g.6030 Transcript_2094/m.6030 type:complete len:231 (-) Transcript_2094:1730-2422(-)